MLISEYPPPSLSIDTSISLLWPNWAEIGASACLKIVCTHASMHAWSCAWANIIVMSCISPWLDKHIYVPDLTQIGWVIDISILWWTDQSTENKHKHNIFQMENTSPPILWCLWLCTYSSRHAMGHWCYSLACTGPYLHTNWVRS